MENEHWWEKLDELVKSTEIVIDRPRGSAHPRYPTTIYPLDYGYLQGTVAGDGGGIDVWRGSLPSERLTGVVVTVDVLKRDSEIKLLLGCTPEEMEMLTAMHNHGDQGGMLITR